MFAADRYSARLSIRRAELTEVQDDGPFQRISALGYADETLKLGHRVQPFGLTSHPPKGAHGLAMLINGRSDQSVFLGIEHPSHRPKSIPMGTTALYNAHGDIIKIFEREIEVVTQTYRVKAASIVFEGDIQVTGDIAQTGGITSTGAHVASAHV